MENNAVFVLIVWFAIQGWQEILAKGLFVCHGCAKERTWSSGQHQPVAVCIDRRQPSCHAGLPQHWPVMRDDWTEHALKTLTAMEEQDRGSFSL
jgi:hypothetical protein